MGLFLLAVVTGAWFWGALAKKVRVVVKDKSNRSWSFKLKV